MAELLGRTLEEVLAMKQWELEVWREEFRRRNALNHTQQEHAAVRNLLAKARARRAKR